MNYFLEYLPENKKMYLRFAKVGQILILSHKLQKWQLAKNSITNPLETVRVKTTQVHECDQKKGASGRP